MGPWQVGQVAAASVAAWGWMQAWQNTCPQGSTAAAGLCRKSTQMRQTRTARGADGSCPTSAIAAAGLGCSQPLAGLEGLAPTSGIQRFLSHWEHSEAPQSLAALRGSSVTRTKRLLFTHWQNSEGCLHLLESLRGSSVTDSTWKIHRHW